MRLFRFGEVHIDATLIDSIHVRKDSVRSNNGNPVHFEVRDYMVEFPGADGTPTRLVVRAKSFDVDMPDVGGIVPIVVDKSRTKGRVDLDDARVSKRLRWKAERRDRSADQDEKRRRFDAKLRDRP